MLTIDEYIAKKKKADKLDEFDYSNQSENMAAVMKYVMSYFNEYLTMEACDNETIKMKHSMDKLEAEVEKKYPQSKQFILEFYSQHKFGIHKVVNNWLKNIKYFVFFYSEEDFSSAANDFCSTNNIKDVDMNKYYNDIKILISEIKVQDTEGPGLSDMIHLDHNMVTWVKDTYKQYGVNLISFAADLAYSYYERYVKYERGYLEERLYHVNNYNHRYNSNPFGIDRIYEENKFRPFLVNRRGELEMLVMREWLFSWVNDDDYWPEYVNLCVSRGRVNIAKGINVLIPVTQGELKYPEDVVCVTEQIIAVGGILKKKPQGAYILRLDVTQENSEVWQNPEAMKALASNLCISFKENGIPEVLEITAPLKTASFEEDIFLSCCSILEKKMSKHPKVKVAIVNGSGNLKAKLKSYISTVEDIIKLKVQLRERKIRISFSIDFPALFGNRKTTYNQQDALKTLSEIKNSVICLSMTDYNRQLSFGPRYKEINKDHDAYYLDKYKYPSYDDFYTYLSAAFNDNQKRYLIPKNISSNDTLEELVDNLLRSGFAFVEGGNQNE